MDVRNLAKRFMNFEKEHDLFKLQVEGVYFWKLIRGRVYTNIQKEIGIVREKSYTVPTRLFGRIKNILAYCAAAAVNAFKPIRKAEILILNHPRKVICEGEYKDIYTDWLIRGLRDNDRDYLVLDTPLNWNNHPMKPDNKTRKIENFSIVKKVFYKYFSSSRLERGSNIEVLSQRLIDAFAADGDVAKEAFSQIKLFQIDFRYYTKLLRKIQPKKIWVVIGYAHHGMIAAAQELGITVEEVQHGLISLQHMNYSFGGIKDIPYFPDRMCLFGRLWYNICDLPLDVSRIDYYRHPIRNNIPTEREEAGNKKILFLSQPTIAKSIFAFIEEMAMSQHFKDYEIIVKLHPSEYHIWKQHYRELLVLKKQGIVQVVDSHDISLYDLFRRINTVIAVASTSFFEALYFGCDSYLLHVPGIEWMESIKARPYMRQISSVGDLFGYLNNSAQIEVDIEEIFTSEGTDDIAAK